MEQGTGVLGRALKGYHQLVLGITYLHIRRSILMLPALKATLKSN